MIEKLKYTLRHTAIYSLGNIATKLSGIILLPFYLKYLSVAEYGIQDVVFSTVFVLTQLLILGQPHALIKHYTDRDFEYKKGVILNSSLIFIVIVSGSVLIGAFIFADVIKDLFNQSLITLEIVRLMILITLVRILNTLILNFLRAEERSLFYASSNILKLIINLVLNIYFIAYLRIGIEGIFYAFIASETFQFILIFSSYLKKIEFKVDLKIIKALVIFGFPLIFSGFTNSMLNFANRYLLLNLVGEIETGYFALAAKIGGFINVFLVQAFSLSIFPIALKMLGREGDKRYMNKVLNYYMFILFWIGLFISLFSFELIEVFSKNPKYNIVYKAVPIIILGFIFLGAKSVVIISLYFKGKTKVIAYISFVALLINLSLNYFLIPIFKFQGAAIANLLSFIAFFFLTKHFADKAYKIPYDLITVLKVLGLSTILFFIPMVFATSGLFLIILKIFVLISFPVIIYKSNILEKIEKERINQYLLKAKKIIFK